MWAGGWWRRGMKDEGWRMKDDDVIIWDVLDMLLACDMRLTHSLLASRAVGKHQNDFCLHQNPKKCQYYNGDKGLNSKLCIIQDMMKLLVWLHKLCSSYQKRFVFWYVFVCFLFKDHMNLLSIKGVPVKLLTLDIQSLTLTVTFTTVTFTFNCPARRHNCYTKVINHVLVDYLDITWK
jgi:hypothetical protein